MNRFNSWSIKQEGTGFGMDVYAIDDHALFIEVLQRRGLDLNKRDAILLLSSKNT